MKGFNLFHKDKRKRVMALILTAVMVLSYLPAKQVEAASPGAVTTVADPETLHRPIDIYGHDTLHAGKITVGKSVSDDQTVFSTMDGVNLGGLAPADNNFLVTLSQSAQAMGLASKLPVPIDAVFVLDTSGSMDDPENDPRYINMISAANDAIAALMAANNQNRVAVVAFSSEDYGAGTSNDAAANVLSDLAHYDGDAASAHLQRVNSSGEASASGEYVAGRKSETITTYETQRVQVGTDWRGNPIYDWRNVEVTKNINAYRKAQEGGTNIQAGIALGASLLMDSTKSTTAQVNGKIVTRMPFIIVLSDGSPTFSATASNWYDASSIAAAGEQGPGSAPYAGNGFLAAMVAAYYKGAITERYFGENASEDNRCNIYTVGVDIGSDMTVSETALAEMTLNPAEEYVNTNSWYNTMQSYVDSYTAGNAFNINVGGSRTEGRNTVYFDSNFNINRTSIANSRNYVNGNNASGINMYAGGFRYNDDYFESDGDAASLNDTFKELVRLIQIKAISVPTDTSVSADFGGYVHFYDPIGEYMEVKNIHGIVSDGYFFRGASFAKNMVNYGTADANPVFDSAMTAAFNGRLELSDSDAISAAEIKALKDQVIAADGQLYYNNNTDYNNSFCWWGNSYTDDHGDEHVQYMGFANDDSIEAIEAAVSANQIPAGADYVCRSYYYHGTAGGEIDPVADFLLMAVRVQRSLTAPYQQTVYVSIPGSLLSVDRVLITEDQTQNPHTFESFVQTENPIRVIYEVGLQSDINSYNVAQKLAGTAYVAEKTLDKPAGGHEVDNYDSTTDTYYFYTNDWDRSKLESEHTRALAHAGFDVAADNDFYTFVEDTPLYADTNGTKLTTAPVPGNIYYYQRTYYDWTGNAPKNTAGTIFDCTEKTAYIEVVAPDAASIASSTDTNASGEYYVKAGTYTASSLSTDTDDVLKEGQNGGPANPTGTSIVVAHPMRTNDLNDSHYTTLLGNNGRLALKAEKAKNVNLNSGTSNAEGALVTVGDILTYNIDVVNEENAAANAVVTDKVPDGTKIWTDSNGQYEITFDANGTTATGSGSYDAATKTVTWNIQNIPVDGKVSVSFKVEVTEDALGQAITTVDNAATIQVGNNPAYTTNKIVNPPYGKYVEGIGEATPTGGVKVGDELSYHIEYYNNTATTADVITIVDRIPVGTTYIANSATHGGVYAVDNAGNRTITWTISNVAPGVSGIVSFQVVVDESAKTPVENGATIEIGTNGPEYTTNTTSTDVLTGDLKLSKTVTGTGGDQSREFTLTLTSMGAENVAFVGISGDYEAERNGVAEPNDVVFTNGVATVTIKHGDNLLIKGLPAGLILSVTENAAAGYTPTYENGQTVVIEAGKVNDTAVGKGITNTYAAEPYVFQLHGTKVLDTDEYFTDANFVFEVYKYSGDNWTGTTEFATSSDATVSSDNKSAVFHFAPRTFTIADAGKHYYYVIEEKIPTDKISGVTYDSTKYYLELEVKNNTTTGKIDVISSIYSDMGTTLLACTGDADATNDITNTTVTFTNKFDTTSLHLTATKVLRNKNLQAGQFAFEILEGGTVVSRGQNAADGKIVFAPITYTSTGTHTYIIKETNSGLDGYKYDNTDYTVEVTVSRVNGKLEAQVTKVNTVDVTNGTYSLVFTNTYVPLSTTFDFDGTKVLNNLSGDSSKNLTAGQFKFEVLDSAGNVVSTGTNDGQGKIDFTPITVSAVDSDLAQYESGVTYSYTVKEVIPTGGAKDPYMNYDIDNDTIQVNVKVNKTTGQLEATVVGNPTISFTNTQYPSSAQVTPIGKKVTVDSTNQVINLDNATFSFHVVDVISGAEATVGVGKANGVITFRPITYTTPNTTYKYWIKESNAGSGSSAITYATNKYLMEVSVSQEMIPTVIYKAYASGDVNNVDSYTTVIQNPSEEVTFTNEYKAVGKLNVIANKALVDRTLIANEFAFKLQPSDANGNVSSLVEIDGLNDAQGVVNFATIYYSSADLDGGTENTLYYKMSEFIPTTNKTPGITYDQSEYVLTVKLTGDSAQISPAITGIRKIKDANGVACNENVDLTGLTVSGDTVNIGVTFKNTYKAVSGTFANILAKKSMPERNLNADEFIFSLHYIDGVNNPIVATARNDSGGNVSFTRNYLPSAIDFGSGLTKTYKYMITEENNHLENVDYDLAKYWVTVTVENDTANARLKIADNGIKYYSNEACTVQIADTAVVFNNQYTPKPTEYPLTGFIKELKNRPLYADEFVFEVIPIGGTTVVSTGMANADTDNDGKGEIVFTPIALNAAQIYEYKIVEKHTNMAGIDYSDTTYYLRINVENNMTTGELEVESAKYYEDSGFTTVADLSKLIFTNTYTVDRIAVPVKATKTLTGRDLKDNEFDFVLIDKGDLNDANDDVVISRADNVAATNPADPDDVVFTLNYELGQLGGANSKTFVYYMSEETPVPNAGGVAIDGKEYVVAVTIEHDQTNAILKSEVKYYDSLADYQANNARTSVPAFVNTYTTTPAKVSVDVQKNLIGKQIKNAEFAFEVWNSDENGSEISKLFTTNPSNIGHTVTIFNNMEFAAAGTYYYKVKEAANATVLKNSANEVIGTYVNDDSEYLIKVDVTDDLQGDLHATTSYYELKQVQGISGYVKEVVTDITFTNYYTPAEIRVPLSTSIRATKNVESLNNYVLGAGEFSFVVKDVTGNKIADGSNDVNGNIIFDDFKFKQAGEYRYWISEVVPSNPKPYITYDNNEWELHITVSYAHDDVIIGGVTIPAGSLYIADGGVMKYSSARAAVPGIEFLNKYNPTPVALTITADKVLTGRPMHAGEFIFRVLEGDVIRAESHNDADGNIVFNFTESVAGTHTYKIVEVEPTTASGGVQYDTQTVGTVQVTVTDAGDGQIKIDGNAIYTGADVAVFTNTYTPAPVDAVITAKKVLHGAQLGAGTFTFELVDRTTGAVVDTATNDADGNITFTKRFDTVGQYPFLIQEKAGTDSTITYDTTQFALVVEVEDDLAGRLVATVDYQRAAVFENTYTPPVVPEPESDIIYKSFAFNKVWDDNNNAAGKRPDSITLELYQDGVYVTDMTLTAADGWIGSTVLMYSQGEHVYEWTIKEKDVPQGYKASYDQSAYTVTNTYGNGKAGSTGTGDNSNIGLYIGLSAVCLAAIAALLVLMKFRKKEDEE